MRTIPKFLAAAACVWPLLLPAQQQTSPELAGILERLDRLERDNRALSAEVTALRARLDAAAGPATPTPSASTDDANAPPAAPAPTIDERLTIQEQRTAEMAQTKVEAAQRFPIRLTGMALFNAYMNSRQAGGNEYPAVASNPGPRSSGATVRQSIVGLDFRGPGTFWGGTVHGSVYMDFFAGATNQAVRLRTGSIEIDWASRNIMAGVEKPIFNPREPSSLAQVGISPLTGSGNLWLWVPQVRVEQDVHFTRSTGIRAQMGVVQTHEVGPYTGSSFNGPVEAARPGLEGRYEFFHNFDDERRIEIAPGFHTSITHAGGFSVPSNLFSLDWLFNPSRRFEFTGAFYSGQNVTPLGAGYQQGYSVYGRYARAVESRGGWAQLTLHLARRLDLHLLSGQQDDNNRELDAGRIGKNLMYGGNIYFRLAPNVLLGPEFTQLRTMYLSNGLRINNHYDFALAYLF